MRAGSSWQKDKRLPQVRVTAAELEQIGEAVRLSGSAQSDWIRSTLIRAAKRRIRKGVADDTRGPSEAAATAAALSR